jgi:hypothetical protein
MEGFFPKIIVSLPPFLGQNYHHRPQLFHHLPHMPLLKGNSDKAAIMIIQYESDQ